MSADERIPPNYDTTDVVAARIGAQVIDLVIMFVQALAIGVGLSMLFDVGTAAEVRALTVSALITLPLYGGLLEGYWNGQTVGKRFLDIKVVERQGFDPSPGQAFLRNIPAVVLFSWLTTVVALAAIAMSNDRQRLFDAVADTYVVRASETPFEHQSSFP